MGQRFSQILPIVCLAMLAWFAYSLMGRLHWLLPLAVTILTIANVATIWMVREHPGFLADICRGRFLKQYVRCVCYFSGDQPLLERSSGSELLVHSQRDFRIAGERAKQIVRGHDKIIDAALARIHENLTLGRSRRDGACQGPLASFLLVGGEGVGKRYLTRVLAKLLYRSSAVEVFECDRVTPNLLVGMKGSPGELLEMVRRQPYKAILFERVDAASAETVKLLVQLLTTGKLRSPGSDKDVYFQNTTVFFSTTQAASALASLAHQPLCEAAWRQRAIETVGNETLLDQALLNAVTDLFFCQPPTDLVKAEVVALLMSKECTAHNVTLSYVEPEILATQVIQVDDANGFGLAPQRVKKLLRKPLVAAAARGHRSLSLRVRRQRQLTSLQMA